MELNPEALSIAAELDRQRTHGLGNTLMSGIPVLLKDNIATGDRLHTTVGAYAMRDWQAGRDAFLVSQLREAGAIILGKANLSEWANYMDPNMPGGFSTLGRQTRNPYGPYDVLGSSSGSAVAAAAYFAAVTVGSESQGSLMQPAAIISVVALKTSRGLVSRDNIIPLLDWMDVPGPMGRTVTDVAVLLTAMMGVDKNDAATLDAGSLAGTDFTRYLRAGSAKKLRVGIVLVREESVARYIRVHNVDREQQDAVRSLLTAYNTIARQAGAVFTELGLDVVEVDSSELPTGEDIMALLEFGFKDSLDRFLAAPERHLPLSSLAAVIAINDEDPDNRAPYGQQYLKDSQQTCIALQEYEAMRDLVHTAYSKNLHALFAAHDIDVLVTDFQGYPPAGFPAITIPAGYDEQGQPFGMIMIADFLGEPQLIAAGYAYEQKTLVRKEPDLAQSLQQIDDVISQ
jgi:amidase